jgi:hypothetical protein
VIDVLRTGQFAKMSCRKEAIVPPVLGANATIGIHCRRRKILNLLAFTILFSLTSCNDSSNSKSDAYYFPIVVAESDSIMNPHGAIGSETRGHKYGSAWIRRTLSAKLSRDEVHGFFEKQLLAQGWESSTTLDRQSTNGFVEIDYYCKGDTETELAFERTLPSSPEATSVELAIYWSSGDDGACAR